jgi:hypothetical protein
MVISWSPIIFIFGIVLFPLGVVNVIFFMILCRNEKIEKKDTFEGEVSGRSRECRTVPGDALWRAGVAALPLDVVCIMLWPRRTIG